MLLAALNVLPGHSKARKASRAALKVCVASHAGASEKAALFARLERNQVLDKTGGIPPFMRRGCPSKTDRKISRANNAFLAW